MLLVLILEVALGEVVSIATTGTCKIRGCVLEGNTVTGSSMMLLSATGSSLDENFIMNCTFSDTTFTKYGQKTLLVQGSIFLKMDGVVFHSSTRTADHIHELYEMDVIESSDYQVSNLCFGAPLFDSDNVGTKITIDGEILSYNKINEPSYSQRGWSADFFGRSECGWATPEVIRTPEYISRLYSKTPAIYLARVSLFLYANF